MDMGEMGEEEEEGVIGEGGGRGNGGGCMHGSGNYDSNYVDNRGVVRVGGRRWRRKKQRPMITINLYF